MRADKAGIRAPGERRRGVVPPDADVRDDGVLLHLANVHGSVDGNRALQQRAADYMAAAGLARIVVPMSGSTMLEPGADGISAGLENFGFRYEGGDPYPLGKLAAERFWIDWQAEAPGRRVAFVYVPTIVGPRSAWTGNIARHAEGKTLTMPRVDRFFAVGEDDLCGLFADLIRSGLDNGVSRRFALSTDASLAATVAVDRGGDVAEVGMPRVLWSAIALSHASGLAGKGLSVVRVLGDRLLRGVSNRALIPVSPRYLHLFRRQSENADLFPPGHAHDDAPPIGGSGDLPAALPRRNVRQVAKP